jgi:hypothetical protein
MTRISMVSQRASLLLGWLLASGALTAGCAGDFDEYYAADGGPADGSADGQVPEDGDVDMETADFGSGPFDLDVTLGGTGTGSVVSAPSGINCGVDCNQSYAGGTEVTLIATATEPAVVQWGGACAGTAADDACVLDMTQPRAVTVNFVIPVYTLTVVYAGAGRGAVTSDDGMVDCDGNGVCAVGFEVGTTVTLSALAGFASSFSGWSMDCAGLGECELVMDEDKTVGVTFDDSDEVSMLISRAGTGEGSVTSAPVGIDCGATCSAVFEPGEEITLTAAAAAGSTFMGWSGDCTGTGLTCTLTMSAARSVTATFNANVYTLGVERAGTGMGSINTVPSSALDCGTTCSQLYPHGTELVLRAMPTAGSTFTMWSGACSGTETLCALEVTEDGMATAIFTLNTYRVDADVTGPGKIVSGAGGIDCGADCDQIYEHGRMVTLNAIANDGAAFASWGGACAGELTATCVITVTAAASVSATFTATQHTVTASTTDVGVGTITSDDGGISCGADCMSSVSFGDVVTFTAAAAGGSTFIGWGGDCAAEPTNVCTLTIVGDTTVSAAFVIGNEFLTVTKSGTGQGTVASDVAGISCGATCASSFPNGTMVELTATPAVGSTFTSWSGGVCSGSVPTCTVMVDDMISVTAEFTVDQHTLDVDLTGAGSGTVSSTSGTIVCGTGGAMCSETVNYGTTRTLSASSDADSVFVGWSGAECPGTGPCMVSVTADVTVQALFERAPYVLTVARGGTGTGTVVSDVAGINCGADCDETYRHGDIIVLTATASATSDFAGWSGAGCGAAMQCMVTLTQAQTVTAQFNLKQHTLTVTKQGNGAGTVTSSPGAISCGAACNASYSHDTVVTLTATPSAGSDFTTWGGACSGTGTCMVTMDQVRDVTATFTLRQYTLTVTRNGTGSGTVSSTPAGVTCPASGACTGTFNHGTVVQLLANPASSSDFTMWMGAGCTGNGTCNVTMTAATTVPAYFTLKQHQLLVTVGGSGSGTVTSNPAVISCTKTGGTCMSNFTHGTSVTLTAAATSGGGNTFAAWGGACTGVLTNMCTVGMTEARNVSASFTVGSNNLTVSVSGTGTVTSNVGGISCTSSGGMCTQSYTFGQVVRLTAAPGVGRSFGGWGGTCMTAGMALTCDVTMDASKSATATFNVLTYPVEVEIDAAGWGTAQTPAKEIDCPGDCDETLAHGTTITIQALPNPGYTFEGWVDDTPGATGGDCTDLNPAYCTINVTQARQLRAKFRPIYHTVTVSKAGNGNVISTGGAINCGTTCSGSFPTGATLQLTAMAGTGSSFSSWTGACAGQGPVCNLNITGPVSTQAVFTLNSYPVTVSFTGLSVGDVQTTDGSISCSVNGGAGCTDMVSHGTTLTFVAGDISPRSNGPGAKFVRWASGPCANSTSSSCTTTVAGSMNVQAEYGATRILTVNVTGGQLTSNERVVVQNVDFPSTICGPGFNVGYVNPPCDFIVREGTAVSLSALPTTFLGFANWMVPVPLGCNPNNASCGFNMGPLNFTMTADFD